MRETNPLRQLDKKPTLRNGVRAMCAHCMGCTQTSRPSGLSRLIKECSSEGCPLYQFRPYQAKPEQLSVIGALNE